MPLKIKKKIEFIGKTIYHYSSISTLLSMLKNKEIWLFSTSQMNDAKEQRYFLEDLQKNLKEDLAPDFHNKCNSFFNKIYTSLAIGYPYAMCFSCLDDDAAQWERYANNGAGIMIGFNTENLVRIFWGPSCDLIKISYGFNTRNHKHFQNLKDYIINDKLVEGFENERQLIDNILSSATTHKHKSFKSEDECRITTSWGWPITIKNSRLDYCATYNTIKKVVKVDMKKSCQENQINFEDLFDKILIGPKSNQNERELKEYILELGYQKLPKIIEKSNSPLR